LTLYHQNPASILPELIEPFSKKKVVHPKIIKARFDMLLKAVTLYKIDGQLKTKKATGLQAKVNSKRLILEIIFICDSIH